MKNYWLQSRTTRLADEKRITLANRFLSEARDLEAKWKESGLLDGLEKRFTRAQTAVLLQSHRLGNEGGCWCGEDHGLKKTILKVEKGEPEKLDIAAETMTVNAFGACQVIKVENKPKTTVSKEAILKCLGEIVAKQMKSAPTTKATSRS